MCRVEAHVAEYRSEYPLEFRHARWNEGVAPHLPTGRRPFWCSDGTSSTFMRNRVDAGIGKRPHRCSKYPQGILDK